MKICFYALSLISAFSFAPSLAAAEIYRWTDAEGRVHFGDRDHAAPQARPLKEAPGTPNLDHSAQRVRQSLEQSARQRQAQQTERRQQQAAHPRSSAFEAQCDKARQRLRVLQGPVIFYDKNNRPLQVSEKERQARAQALSDQINRHCF